MPHLTYTILLQYLGGQLPEAERAIVESHLFSPPCERCSKMLARLRTVLGSAAVDQTVAPPDDVLRRALAAYRKADQTTTGAQLRIPASLRFDSRLQLSLTGSRGAARTRQMLFAAPDVDIDLQITLEHGEHHLVGQVLTAEQADHPSPAFVSLQNESGELLRGTETDLRGQFTLSQIPTGIYDLLFDMGVEEVAVIGLKLDND